MNLLCIMCLRLVLFTPNNIINAGPKGLASLNVIRQRYKGVEMMNTSIVKYGVLTIGSPSIIIFSYISRNYNGKNRKNEYTRDKCF